MYKDIIVLHAVDSSTAFLSPFKDRFGDKYLAMGANERSIEETIKSLQNINSCSLIIFLGHGHSTGLYSPSNSLFEKRIIIDVNKGNEIFQGNDVFLLSCNSNQFIDRLNGYRNIIGFGNIISSREELLAELDYTGERRNLDEEDIQMFNSIYIDSIIKSFSYVFEKKYSFTFITKYIRYHINKNINEILKNKSISNRKEIAKLLFEFRDEMISKTTLIKN